MDKVTDRIPVPTDRALRIMKWVVIAAGAAFAIYLLVTMAQISQSAEKNARDLTTAEQDRERLESRVDVLGKDVDKRDSAVRTANRRLNKAGEKPVTVPDQPVSVPKVDGQPVLTSDDVLTLIEAEVKTQHPDLTQAQRESITSAAAVKAAARIPAPRDGKDGTDAPSLDDLRPIIRTEVARIPTPADGQDGRTPSAEEVAAAITTLCGGECRGPAGADGKAGTDGRDGVDGQPGKDGADSIVPGPDGKPGADGKDGRGITAITCDTSGDWQITYSDGTTSTLTGPCRVVAPEPEPTPTSTEPTPTTTEEPTP